MPFLHYETHRRRMSMTTTIESARRGHRPRKDASRDELLVHAYWKNQLHMRRTLDQYFYHGIDTTQRDSDQVVWRYCDRYRRPEEPKLFMVDQLWMWILGGGKLLRKKSPGIKFVADHSFARHRNYLLPSTMGSTKARSAERCRWNHSRDQCQNPQGNADSICL